MQRKNVGLIQLSDIMAFRILVDNVEQCYQALGVIHSHYHVIPGRFKDYISTPKPNQYHPCIPAFSAPSASASKSRFVPKTCHQIAELGVAAHWGYKEGAPRTKACNIAGCASCWTISNTRRSRKIPRKHQAGTVSGSGVLFFAQGRSDALPRGAPVDFAYACMPRRRRLHGIQGQWPHGAFAHRTQKGDQVEIVTAKRRHPVTGLERFVVTGKAKACIRRFVRAQHAPNMSLLGKSILDSRYAIQEGVDFSEKAFEAVCRISKARPNLPLAGPKSARDKGSEEKALKIR